MTRKRCLRRHVEPTPPPGLRPRLSRGQVRDLGLAHIANLDTIATGAASEAVLWQWAAGALTWSRVADQLHSRPPAAYSEALTAMHGQLEIVESVANRFARTHRVGFSGPELQCAREACEWMDALAEVVDQRTAASAADWSEQAINEWMTRSARKEIT